MGTKKKSGGYSYPFQETDEKTKRAVWAKGRVIPGYEPSVWRHDACGAVMRYSQHGEEGEHGWEIDHIYPRSKGGKAEISNLQPLYWRNNRRKGDQFPWSC